MTKKIIIISTLLSLIFPVVAKAEPQQVPTVAILDTALDSSLPIFKDKVVQEVCVLEYESCLNKKSYMEGPGAASMPLDQMQKNGFDHGTQMASALVKTNPNIKFVFVRIIGATSNGTRQVVSEKTFVSALDWVIANKDQYNIQAVSMSQGHHNLPNVTDYCPKTPSTQSRIKSLQAAGIPTFLPAGNTRDYKRIDWPACIDESISIGAVSQYQEIPNWSNMDVNKVDFYSLGVMQLVGPGNVVSNQMGTSISTQVAAANWLALKSAKPLLSYDQIYSLFKKTSVPVYNPTKAVGYMMYFEGALNG
jgi:hypothetical protein